MIDKLKIPGYGKYTVDIHGNVYGKKILKQRLTPLGYKIVTLKLNGKSVPTYSHTLIILAFQGYPPETGHKYTVDHIDRDPSNNTPINLRWATCQQQVQNSQVCDNIKRICIAKYRKIELLHDGKIVIFENMNLAVDFIRTQHKLKIVNSTIKRNIYRALLAKNLYYGFWSKATYHDNYGEFAIIPSDKIRMANDYYASDLGYIKTPHGTITKGSFDKNSGYMTININRHEYRVHRLIAFAFLKNNEINQEIVNHIDGDKTNNKKENLEWVTHKRNSLHAFQIGLSKTPKGRAICKINVKTDDIIKVFTSVREAAKSIGKTHCNLVACCAGRQKTAYGFGWKYIESV